MNGSNWVPVMVMVWAAASGPLAADTPPPVIPHASASTVTLPAKPSGGIWMGSLHVVLEQTDLPDIQQAAAAGTIDSRGDAGAAHSWLCYTNLSSREPERIWLSTQDEMGGPERRVMSVTAMLLPGGRATADCPPLPAILTPVRIDDGLWLNGSVQALADALHTPVEAGPEWQQFNYSVKAAGTGSCGPEGFDLLNQLVVHLRAGRVVLLQVNQDTSC